MARQRRQTGRSSAGRKTTAKRSTTKRSTAKRTTAKRTTAKRTTAKRTTAKRTTAKRSTAKRSTAKRSTAKRTTAKRSTAKRTAAKRSTAKRSTAKRTAAKRLTARRGSTTRATASRTTEAPSKDDLVDRLDRRLRRLKREELQQLLEGVEAGRVNLAAVSGGVAGGRATIPAGTTGVAPSLARGAAKASAGTVKLDSLQDVLQEQIEDLYSAETQLVQALPKVAQAASTNELRQAFEQHLEETRGHVRRLEQIFGQVGISSPSEFCEGMEGLIREAEEIVAAKGDAAARDAALIAAAQRVEHYEIAGYGTARTLAEELGRAEAKRLLDETLDEEKNADALLTRLATGGRFGTGINEAAEETASDRS